jgi:hypothetical protein
MARFAMMTFAVYQYMVASLHVLNTDAAPNTERRGGEAIDSTAQVGLLRHVTFDLLLPWCLYARTYKKDTFGRLTSSVKL